MRLPLYQIDAFTDRRFGGNPAAVVPLAEWLPDAVLQAIAAENNLSETAFFTREGEDYALRWFTPAVEVDLCGHATLASAYAIFRFLEPQRDEVGFRTLKAGRLSVAKRGDLLAMDFPARPARPCAAPAGLAEALGKAPAAVLAARDILAVYARAEDVEALAPGYERPGARRLLRGDRHRAGQRRRRFRLALLRAAPGDRRGPRDRLGALHAGALLGRAAGQAGAQRAPGIAPRRRACLRASEASASSIAGRCVLYLEGAITL